MSDAWLLSGVYYGYPLCCIDEFTEYAEGKKDLSRRGKRKFNGTGYVPCEECNKLSKETLLKQIESRRLHWEPFPKCGPNTEEFADFSRWVANTFLESFKWGEE